MNEEAYTMIGERPVCKVRRDLHCSQKQALSGELVEVYSATCDHHWVLTKEESESSGSIYRKTAEIKVE